MISSKVFSNMISSLNSELLSLKEFRSKSANTLATASQDFTLNFDYKLETDPATMIRWGVFTKSALITLETGLEAPLTSVMVEQSSIKSMYEYPLYINRFYDLGKKQLGFTVYGYDYNNNDVNKLASGQKVSATIKIRITCTASFTAKVEYKAN